MKERELFEALDAVMKVTLDGRKGEIEIEPIIAIRIPRNEIVRRSSCVTYCGETV